MAGGPRPLANPWRGFAQQDINSSMVVHVRSGFASSTFSVSIAWPFSRRSYLNLDTKINLIVGACNRHPLPLGFIQFFGLAMVHLGHPVDLNVWNVSW